MNWLKRKKEERLRAKIALKASYTVNDLKAVYGFVKNGTPVSSGTKLHTSGRVLSQKTFTVRRFIS